MHQLTQRLIDRIHAQTENGQIRWREGASKSAFAFEADDYNVVVDANPSTVTLLITDGDGRELETLDEEDLSAVSSPGGRDYEAIVRDIHANARRVAMGTDDAIERILRAMGEDEGGSGRW
ncbi:MAG: hypothetical protein PVI23_01040 [Maricaulaceae bacterium]|jgi:hypothetical protein